MPPHEGSNTTHYSIVDSKGNAVAVTYTLNDWFGAKVTAAKTGVLLNDEMDDFTAKLGVPNIYGLVQGEANAIAPGKRPLSSMSPTIVTKDGKPVMVVGTPGGSRIITAVLHTIINVIDYGMNVQEAVDAPRFHQQWLPNPTNIEPFALSPDTKKILEGMGHMFGESAAGEPRRGDPRRCAVDRRQAGRQQPLLRRQRPAAQQRARARVLTTRGRSRPAAAGRHDPLFLAGALRAALLARRRLAGARSSSPASFSPPSSWTRRLRGR